MLLHLISKISKEFEAISVKMALELTNEYFEKPEKKTKPILIINKDLKCSTPNQ